jgi:F0F1-type ATP synthase assembly protein I
MKRFGGVLGAATELGLTMGFMAAGLIAAGLWLGRWLDSRLGSGPYATLLLLIAGAIAGQIAIYRLAVRSTVRLSAEEKHPVSAGDAASALRTALLVLGLLAMPGLVGLLLGIWLNRAWGVGLWAALILMLIGLVGGLVGAMRVARSARPTADQQKDNSL